MSRAKVQELRCAAYKRSNEFYVEHSRAYQWSEDDDVSDVMVACDERGEALATMRGANADGRAEVEARFECSAELTDEMFPALLLERGATKGGSGGLGLNSLLRYHFLLGALRSETASVVGAVFDGAPRLHLLAELGYEFRQPTRTWDTNLRPRTQLILVTLPRHRIAQATETLRDRFGAVISAFPWHGPTLRYAVGTPRGAPPPGLSPNGIGVTRSRVEPDVETDG